MIKDNELQLGFSSEDTQKALQVLSRLIPYVVPENLVLVGGLARRHHLLRSGISFPQRPFNDLDVMIRDRTELNSAVTEQFLIAHYHLPTVTSFFTELVEPKTKVAVDVFDYYHAPIDPEEVQIAGFQLKIRRAEDQLTKTVYDLMKITKGHTISPKEFASAEQLLQIVNLDRTEEIWRMKYARLYPFSLMEAIQQAREEGNKNPGLVFENPIRTTEPFDCSECSEEPGFALTPKEEIIRVLGYIDRP